jgi:transcriptional regulator with XRE-family HTH domain
MKANTLLKHLRRSSGHTQKEVGLKLKCVEMFVSNWERGLSLPPKAMLKKLIIIYKMTPEDCHNLAKAMTEQLLDHSKKAAERRVAPLLKAQRGEANGM